MGIRQEKRVDAPQVEVMETDYGAKFVKAAKETPVEQQVEEVVEQPEEVTPVAEAAEPVVPAEPKKRGRKKKVAK